MDQQKLIEFRTKFEDFKKTDEYEFRESQRILIPLFRSIIEEVIKNQPFKEEYLTAFIQLFRWNCTSANFAKHISICIRDKNNANQFLKQFENSKVSGFTNVGMASINNLNKPQLDAINTFLRRAFDVIDVSQAIKLCTEFEALNIPSVKRGIYSPWLFYINPNVFPIINNTHNTFKKWFGLSDLYSENIIEFAELKEIVNEPDLSNLDYMAYLFTEKGEVNYKRTLNLNGERIFKISHGAFSKEFRNSSVRKVLEDKQWICIHKNTSKNQGNIFVNNLKIGDYVYICYGGDELSFIGRIKSDVFVLPEELLVEMSNEGEPWVCREIDAIFKPRSSEIDAPTRGFKRAFYPSGYTTVAEIPKDAISEINKNLFLPYYNVEITDIAERDNELNEDLSGYNKLKKMSKNIILYGPPGTGKTYNSINYAVAIVENKTVEEINIESNINRNLVKNRFDEYLKNGQIVFTTFHQNLSYEDFIEGIKPSLSNSDIDDVEGEANLSTLDYVIEPGIFKSLCINAEKASVINEVFNFDSKWLEYYNYLMSFEGEIVLKSTDSELKFEKAESTENSLKVRFKKSYNPEFSEGTRVFPVGKNGIKKIFDARINLTDPKVRKWVEISKIIGKGRATVYYSVYRGFFDFCGLGDVFNRKNEVKPHVLIVDEINRGNVSQIFGELITLIEDDKRIGQPEALTATLPYSKEQFGVPSNLYIIGTMNTADRSVEALDTALRRRFSFVPKLPEESTLGKTEEGIDLSKILKTINTRLTVLKDRDHTIGHAWFWNIKNIETLKNVFSEKIIPLLNEYFYNDYEKLGLVLGDSFFRPYSKVNRKLFASFKAANNMVSQYDQVIQFELKATSELTIDDFKSLEDLISVDHIEEDE